MLYPLDAELVAHDLRALELSGFALDATGWLGPRAVYVKAQYEGSALLVIWDDSLWELKVHSFPKLPRKTEKALEEALERYFERYVPAYCQAEDAGKECGGC